MKSKLIVKKVQILSFLFFLGLGCNKDNQPQTLPPEFLLSRIISITNTTVNISVTLNPNNLPTTITIEYGLSSDYGSIISSKNNPIQGGEITNDTLTLTGLISGLKYHYRFKIENTKGLFLGSDSMFITTIKDFDGNDYTSVPLGTQVWLKENLITTKFNNSAPIQYVPDINTWTNLSTGGYCWYDNNQLNKNKYGALYNWYAVNSHRLCPSGWHVPSMAEWNKLILFLGGSTIGGGKLKETGTTNWVSPNSGATNDFSFTALPAGARAWYGEFLNFNWNSYFWTSNEDQTIYAFSFRLNHDNTSIDILSQEKKSGLTVRCMRD